MASVDRRPHDWQHGAWPGSTPPVNVAWSAPTIREAQGGDDSENTVYLFQELTVIRQEIAALQQADARTKRDIKECRVSVSDLEALLRGEMQRMGARLTAQEQALEVKFDELVLNLNDFKSLVQVNFRDQDAKLNREVAQLRQQFEAADSKIAAEMDAKIAVLQDSVFENSRHVGALEKAFGDFRATTDRSLSELRAEMQAADRELDDRLRRELMQIGVLRKEMNEIEQVTARNAGDIRDTRSALSETDAALRSEIHRVAKQAESGDAEIKALVSDLEKSLERELAMVRTTEVEHYSQIQAWLRDIQQSVKDLDDRSAREREALADRLASEAALLCATIGQTKDELELQLGDVEEQGREQVASTAQRIRLELQTERDRISGAEARLFTVEASVLELDSRMQREVAAVAREDQMRDAQTRETLEERTSSLDRRIADCAEIRDQQKAQLQAAITSLDGRLERELSQLSREVDARLSEERSWAQARCSELHAADEQLKAGQNFLQSSIQDLDTSTKREMAAVDREAQDRDKATRSTLHDYQTVTDKRIGDLDNEIKVSASSLRSTIQSLDDHVQRELAQLGRDMNAKDRELGDMVSSLKTSTEASFGQLRSELLDEKRATEARLREQATVLEHRLFEQDKAIREVISHNESAAERTFSAIKADVAEIASSTDKTFGQVRAEAAEMQSSLRGLLQDQADTSNRRFAEQDKSLRELISNNEKIVERSLGVLRAEAAEEKSATELKLREEDKALRALLLDQEKATERSFGVLREEDAKLREREDVFDRRLVEQATAQEQVRSSLQAAIKDLDDRTRREMQLADQEHQARDAATRGHLQEFADGTNKRFGEQAEALESAKALNRSSIQALDEKTQREIQQAQRDMAALDKATREMIKHSEKALELGINMLRSEASEFKTSMQTKCRELEDLFRKEIAAQIAKLEGSLNELQAADEKLKTSEAQLKQSIDGVREQAEKRQDTFDRRLSDQQAAIDITRTSLQAAIKDSDDKTQREFATLRMEIQTNDRATRAAIQEIQEALDKRLAGMLSAIENVKIATSAAVQACEVRLERELAEVAGEIEAKEKSQLDLLKDHERGMERSMAIQRGEFVDFRGTAEAKIREETEKNSSEVAKLRALLDARFADLCEAHEEAKRKIAHMPAEVKKNVDEVVTPLRQELLSSFSRVEYTVSDQGTRLLDLAARVETQTTNLQHGLHDLEDRTTRQVARSVEELRAALEDQKAFLADALAKLQQELDGRAGRLEGQAADQARATDKAAEHSDSQFNLLQKAMGDLEARMKDTVGRSGDELQARYAALREELRRFETELRACGVRTDELRAEFATLSKEFHGLTDRFGVHGEKVTGDFNSISVRLQSGEDRSQRDLEQLRSQIAGIQSETMQIAALDHRISTTDKSLREMFSDHEHATNRVIDMLQSKAGDENRQRQAEIDKLRMTLTAQMTDSSDILKASIHTLEERLQKEDDQMRNQFNVLEREIETRYNSNHELLETREASLEKRFECMKADVGDQVNSVKAQLREEDDRIRSEVSSIKAGVDVRLQEERAVALEVKGAVEATAMRLGQDQDSRASMMKQDFEVQLARLSQQSLRTTEGLNLVQASLRDFDQKTQSKLDQMEKTRMLVTDRQDGLDKRFREQAQVQEDNKSLVMSAVQNLEGSVDRKLRTIGGMTPGMAPRVLSTS